MQEYTGERLKCSAQRHPESRPRLLAHDYSAHGGCDGRIADLFLSGLGETGIVPQNITRIPEHQ